MSYHEYIDYGFGCRISDLDFSRKKVLKAMKKLMPEDPPKDVWDYEDKYACISGPAALLQDVIVNLYPKYDNWIFADEDCYSEYYVMFRKALPWQYSNSFDHMPTKQDIVNIFVEGIKTISDMSREEIEKILDNVSCENGG